MKEERGDVREGECSGEREGARCEIRLVVDATREGIRRLEGRL